MPVKIKEREYRNFTIETRTPEEGTEEKIVTGYASVFDHEYTLYSDDTLEIREKVAPDAFAEADMSDVIFQYNHEGRVFARTSNETLKVNADDKGLAIEANLGGTEIGRDLYEEIRGGYTNKMSYGYSVTGDSWESRHEEGQKDIEIRTITKIGKVYDVSAVSIPANDATEISVRSLSDGVIEKAKAERQKALELARKKTETRMRLGGH